MEASKTQTGQCTETFSCSTWTRTRDDSINSRGLYQLSYGTIKSLRLNRHMTTNHTGFRFLNLFIRKCFRICLDCSLHGLNRLTCTNSSSDTSTKFTLTLIHFLTPCYCCCFNVVKYSKLYSLCQPSIMKFIKQSTLAPAERLELPTR